MLEDYFILLSPLNSTLTCIAPTGFQDRLSGFRFALTSFAQLASYVLRLNLFIFELAKIINYELPPRISEKIQLDNGRHAHSWGG